MSVPEAGQMLAAKLRGATQRRARARPLTPMGEVEDGMELIQTPAVPTTLRAQGTGRSLGCDKNEDNIRRQVTRSPIQAVVDDGLPLPWPSVGAQSVSDKIPALPGPASPEGAVEPSAATASAGVSAFFARVLNQLALSTWLPAAFLAASVTVLLQFRTEGSVSVRMLSADPTRTLILVISVLVLAALVIQAFSFEAIRVLEGYWRRRGPASLARTLMIRRHLHRREAIVKRRHRASERAFYIAKSRMLSNGVSPSVVDALEAQVLGVRLPSLTSEDSKKFAKINWRSSCDAWRLAEVDHLLQEEKAYPTTSRILPTKLGNLIRATEDRLQDTGGDLEGYAIWRRGMVPYSVRLQHDQFRSRLGMYCNLVFVSASLLILTPIILLGSGISATVIAIISSSFAAFSIISYLAALASADGYCLALTQMDDVTRILTEG
jgi:hypothetical protein